jgi:hypothetical protein
MDFGNLWIRCAIIQNSMNCGMKEKPPGKSGTKKINYGNKKY